MTNRASNSVRVRAYNEKAVLYHLRRLATATKRQLSVATGLSFQATSGIVEALIDRKLVRRAGKQTGSLGQPSTLFEVDPRGSLSIGVEIGRRKLVSVLVDLAGHPIAKLQHEYEYPVPGRIFPLVDRCIRELSRTSRDEGALPLAGVGVSAPYLLGGWTGVLGFPPHVEDAWRGISIPDEVQKLTDMPVYFENDGTAACAAELLLGVGQQLRSFVYFFIGTFTGGGLVLDGALQIGEKGNAGCIGPMPVPPSRLASAPRLEGPFDILMNRASIHSLLRHIAFLGLESPGENSLFHIADRDVPAIRDWMEDAAEALAYAVISCLCVVDVQSIVIDGSLPRIFVREITALAETKVTRMRHEGIFIPKFLVGGVAGEAAAIGAAIMPFYNEYFPDSSHLTLSGASNGLVGEQPAASPAIS